MMIFDIGANVGRWTLANIDTCDKIIAVEASPSIYDVLVKNVSADERAVLLNYAVCNNDGKDITFYEGAFDTVSTLNIDWFARPASRFYNHPFREIVCKTITIDELIKRYGKPDLIKVDVEAGEYECISSLSQKVDMLCFEWASEVNPITCKCLDHLTGLGFTRFYIQDRDEYTFRPPVSEYCDLDTVKERLEETTPKIDWGMIWCI